MRSFGELEQAIMDAVWGTGVPVTGREVSEQLNRDRPQPLAYNTVHTEILHRKSGLTRAKDGRVFRYRVPRSREEYAASLIDQVWETGADRAATLMRSSTSWTTTHCAPRWPSVKRVGNCHSSWPEYS